MTKLTGWGLGDLLQLTVSELEHWLKAAQDVEKEINKKTRKGKG